jgi:NADPH:quinone reductase-like Zn-dependent oxidoreductase
VTLTGYSTENLDSPSLRHAVRAIEEWLRNGAIVAPSRTLFPLREAAAAHSALEQHRIQGRVLLAPDR